MSEQLSFLGFDEDGRTQVSGRRIVYFLETDEFIKIGLTTRDLDERVSELETGHPKQLNVIGSIPIRDDEDDRRFHKQFWAFHHRREWFRKTPELMASIHQLLLRRPNHDRVVRPCILPLDGFHWCECGPMPHCVFDCSCSFCGTFIVSGFAIDAGVTMDTLNASKMHVRCPHCHSKIPIQFRPNRDVPDITSLPLERLT